jgi:deoxyribonuclease V
MYDNISIPEATQIQNDLRSKLDLTPMSNKIEFIAGADISFNKYETAVYAGIVLMRFPKLVPVAISLVKVDVHFPYVPGYLAFREVPALMKAWEQLSVKPDVLVVDGHGIAHPRRVGIAAHFGALTGQCTMGCAKKILCGKFDEPDIEKSGFSPIHHKNEQIGWALRSKNKVKPVFVSPGNNMSLEDSLNIMQECLGKYRLPEPTRLAHEAVNKFRTGEYPEGLMEV